MNVTSYVSELTSRVSPSSAPTLLWKYYLEYLWFYEPNSWVARIAYSFRVFAFFLILPVTVLTLLDIASYVVARTLGVVDEVKAATSDGKSTPSNLEKEPSSAGISVSSSTIIEPHSPPADSRDETRFPASITTTLSNGAESQPQAFFASEENNLKLSGVGVFSPAASRPPSPTVSRRSLPNQSSEFSTDGDSGPQDEGVSLRKRVVGSAIAE